MLLCTRVAEQESETKSVKRAAERIGTEPRAVASGIRIQLA
ncbi:MAG: hypothetical protein QOH71_2684 [Blastocatellia bacterium]|nr:hypothetical protein [Blastocatellia bacterium]